MNRAKFISTLNIALHPATADAEVLAAIRGAYRLLGGKSVDEFLEQTQPFPDDNELAIKLDLAERKLEGAVEYCSELEARIVDLQQQLSATKALRATVFQRFGAFVTRYPVRCFAAASVAIALMASLGKERISSTDQSQLATVTASRSSDAAAGNYPVVRQPDNFPADVVQKYSAIGGWTIEFNRHSKICYMKKIYSNTTELVIAYNGAKHVMFLSTANDVHLGETYTFNLQFHTGSLLPKKEDFSLLEGKAAIDNHHLIFLTLDAQFIAKFSVSTEMTVWHRDQMFETLWLVNQRDALEAMRGCQKALAAASE